MQPQGNPDGAYAVMYTLRALERLALAPHSAPEMASALGVGVRTARRLLRRLALEGWAVQDGGQRRPYRATLRVAALGRVLLDRAALPALAAPVLAGLGRGAHLWVACAGVAVCVVDGAGGGAPAAAVLGRGGRSCTWVAGQGAAAAVLDRGAVVAAVGVAGEVGVEAAALAMRAGGELTERLVSVTARA